MKPAERARLYRVRPNMLLGNRPHALALRVLASRRRNWDCGHGINGKCHPCFARCYHMPCILLPVEAEAIIRGGHGTWLALDSVSTTGLKERLVEVLFAAPIGYGSYQGGYRMPLEPVVAFGYEERGCSFSVKDRKEHTAGCLLRDFGFKRPLMSVVRACYNWRPTNPGPNRRALPVYGYRSKLQDAEQMYYGLAVYMWSRKYGQYVVDLWKEKCMHGC